MARVSGKRSTYFTSTLAWEGPNRSSGPTSHALAHPGGNFAARERGWQIRILVACSAECRSAIAACVHSGDPAGREVGARQVAFQSGARTCTANMGGGSVLPKGLG